MSSLSRRHILTRQRCLRVYKHRLKAAARTAAQYSHQLGKIWALLAITLSLAVMSTVVFLWTLNSRLRVANDFEPLLVVITGIFDIYMILRLCQEIVHLTAPCLGKAARKQCIPCADRSMPRKINVFIRGVQSKDILMVVSHRETVGGILSELRRRRLAPNLRRVRYYIFCSSVNASPLKSADILEDIGICNNSTVHVRLCVLGGAREHDQAASPQGAPRQTTFTSSTGRFEGKYPDRWEPAGYGHFRCLPCNKLIGRRYVAEHEESRYHHRQLTTYLEVQRDAETAPVARRPLAELLDRLRRRDAEPAASQANNSNSGPVNWESDTLNDYVHHPSVESNLIQEISDRCLDYLLRDGAIDEESDVGEEGREDEQDIESEADVSGGDDSNSVIFGRAPRRQTFRIDDSHSPWFPWSSKEICVLDILRHIPRCAFSEKQNTIIHWALGALGVDDVPTEQTMKKVDAALQKICGVEGIRFAGALGHIYYTNDLAAIIAQELSNPHVRPHLRFYPEDAGCHLSEAWQAKRWLKELDPGLTTPMVRQNGQDFYVLEPAMMRDGRFCMPVRWYSRGEKMFARAWSMSPDAASQSWIVREHEEFDICASDLILSLPHIARVYTSRFSRTGVPHPHNILGIQKLQSGPLSAWTKTDPTVGNVWRARASGHRVLAFPIWLYCDDTSGNLSKKWNKHNSFLFTAAGLPRRFVHREYNVHFLSTSNLAPPLEMLDGIVAQLKECQKDGIWAWDCAEKELVLIIPSVLAMLGDNPMQSEMACHSGFMARMFCRVCWVMGKKSKTGADGGGRDGIDSGDDSDATSVRSVQSEAGSGESTCGTAKRKTTKIETMSEMVERVTRFMAGTSCPRSKHETLKELSSQFTEAKTIGGFTGVKHLRTESGIKDTFQNYFLEKLFAISKRKGISKTQKEMEILDAVSKMPAEQDMISPVWKITDFDPHTDTPVEILHVVLLGFVKYFWRDAIARLNQEKKDTLIARLNSFNTSGLGLPRLAGSTLVNYSGSLTGRDFRAIAQAAPFTLHGLLTQEALDVWSALSTLIPLVWQPVIDDIDQYETQLRATIDYFLDCTCRLTPRWFNKPKFHIIVHLPTHIRRFGPAMLFATEGFESFNAVIRSHSVHSNRHAPSRDIARSMARCNRTRHFLSGGFFRAPASPSMGETADTPRPDHMHYATPEHRSKSPWLNRSLEDLLRDNWVTIGSAPATVIEHNNFGRNILNLGAFDMAVNRDDCLGTCSNVGPTKPWTSTESHKHGVQVNPDNCATLFRTPGQITICGGGSASPGDWVCWDELDGTGKTLRCLGRVLEIIQQQGSIAAHNNEANALVVRQASTGVMHPQYHMPMVDLMQEFTVLLPKDILGLINVQHNCIDADCRITRTRSIQQEREQTSTYANEVKHTGQEIFVLNMGQMRDTCLLKPFRQIVPTLSRQNIILAAAANEVEASRQRNKSSQGGTTYSRKRREPKGKVMAQGALGHHSLSRAALEGQLGSSHAHAGGTQHTSQPAPIVQEAYRSHLPHLPPVGHIPSFVQGSSSSVPSYFMYPGR